MNLEHCRKDAKRLQRGVTTGDAGALERAREVLGERVAQRFGLSDAQHVVATERGYRSWPALAREAAGPARTEEFVTTGLEYRPRDPVCVWILRREGRVSVSDHGAALRKAGTPPGWDRACARMHAELDVNVTRGGVVCLGVFAAGPPEEAVVARIARASLTFFQELLELEEA
jgi:hypothetical protein